MSKPTISFGFTKTRKNNVTPSTTSDNEEVKVKHTDFITSLEEREVISTRPEAQKKELVIPLIETNKWKNPKRPVELDEEDENREESKRKKNSYTKKDLSVNSGDLDDRVAAQELLAEAAVEKEREYGISETRVVPLLVKNKIPDGYETEDKLDVSLRPDEPTPADYDAIPIEEFGMAMLRGMGWNKGTGIGKKGQAIKPVEAVVRPKGLGLGADQSLAKQLRKNGTITNESKGDEEVLLHKKGAHCLVLSGKHSDCYGIIQGVDEDNARLVVNLALSGDTITSSQYAVKLVSKKEYDKYSKYLNKTKADKYRDEQAKKLSFDYKPRDENPDKRRYRKKHRHEDSSEEKRSHDRNYERDHLHDNQHSHKHKKSDYELRGHDRDKYKRTKDKKHKHISSRDSEKGWLRPDLRVRLVDPEYRKGKYFKSKVVIEDVIGRDSCICRTDEGKVLEGLSQSMLETVIPKSDPSYIMIVHGKHMGQLGKILKRDKTSCQASIQLLCDRDRLYQLHYDEICEYTGDINLEFDY